MTTTASQLLTLHPFLCRHLAVMVLITAHLTDVFGVSG